MNFLLIFLSCLTPNYEISVSSTHNLELGSQCDWTVLTGLFWLNAYLSSAYRTHTFYFPSSRLVVGSWLNFQQIATRQGNLTWLLRQVLNERVK